MFIRRVVFLLSGGHGFVLTILLQMFLELFSIFFLFFEINNYIGIRLYLDSDFLKRLIFTKGVPSTKGILGTSLFTLRTISRLVFVHKTKKENRKTKQNIKKQNNFDKLVQCHFRNERLGIPMML